MKRAACYIRVSTVDQAVNGLSLDSQREALEDYCRQQEMQCTIYADEGISAHSSYKKRPALLKMVEDCKAGKIDIILVTKLDRFFRSVPDYYAVMGQHNVPWIAIWEDYETETSAGIFKVNIMLSVAQAESDRTGERIRAVNEYKRMNGQYVGMLPFGYKRDENKKIVHDDNENVIYTFIGNFRKSVSLADAVYQTRVQTGISLSKHIARNIISNPIYRGSAGPEQTQPYVMPEDYALFDADSSRRKREPKEKKNRKMFAGVLICSLCGRRLLGFQHNDNRINAKGEKVVKVYTAYRCGGSYQYKCKLTTYYESKLERRLLAEIERSIMMDSAEISADFEKANKDIEKRQNSIKSRISRLTDMYEMGDIDREEYISKRDSLRFELESLEADKIQKNIPHLPPNWKEIYSELDHEHKCIFWQSVIKSCIVSKESLKITYV